MLDTYFEADCNFVGVVAGLHVEEAIAKRRDDISRDSLHGKLLIVKEELFGHLLIGQNLIRYKRVNFHTQKVTLRKKQFYIEHLYKPHVSGTNSHYICILIYMSMYIRIIFI